MVDTTDPGDGEDTDPGDRVAVDALVVGGGIQGLTILHELAGRGFSTALVTRGPLGEGQTMHMHAIINSAYPAPRRELREALDEGWIPFARDHGVTLYGNEDFFYVAPAEVIERKTALWTEYGYPCDVRPAEALPGGFRDGSLFAAGTEMTVAGVEEYCFSKRGLVAALVEGHRDRILDGEVTGFECSATDGSGPDGEDGVSVDAVHVDHDGGDRRVTVAPGCLVLATGDGTERFLERLTGDPSFRAAAGEVGVPAERPFETIDRVTYTHLHMVCIRGPEDLLPAVNLMIPTEKLRIAGHRLSDLVPGCDDDRVLWYVTPRDLTASVPHELHDGRLPDGGEADPDPGIVRDGLETLLSVYPPLAAVADEGHPGLEATVYAGIKQEYDGEPHRPFCGRVAGTTDVLVALPSVITGAWVNAGRVAEMVAGRVAPSGEGPPLPGGGAGVSIGRHTEDTEAVEWHDWPAFLDAFLDGT